VFDRHLVEEHCEDTLLHLPGILCAENDHLFVSEVDGDTRRARHTRRVSIGGKGASIVNCVVRVEVLQLFPRRANEHVAHEQGMVGSRRDDSNVDPVTLIPTSKAIDDIDAVSGVEVVYRTFTIDFPYLLPKEVSISIRSNSLAATGPLEDLVIGLSSP
jgi:hypothetical protein